jgi:hypothetical protein
MVDNVTHPTVIGWVKSVSGVDSECHSGVDQLPSNAALERSTLGGKPNVSVFHEPPEHIHHAVIEVLDGGRDDYGVLEFHGLIPLWLGEVSNLPPLFD